MGELVPLLEALPKMDDAPRVLKAQVTTEAPPASPKRQRVWNRIGLSRPGA